MATYRSIHTKIWNDPIVEELSPISKLLFIYLLTNNHRNEACLYQLSYKKISNEIGANIDDVHIAMQELISSGRVVYSDTSGYIWVINALKYQVLNPNCKIAVIHNISICSDDSLKLQFIEKYKVAIPELNDLKPLSNGLETVTQPLGNGLETVTQPSNRNRNRNSNSPSNSSSLFSLSDNLDVIPKISISNENSLVDNPVVEETQKKKKPSEYGLQYAEYFKTLIPVTQKATKTDIENWGRAFDLMVKTDKRQPSEIYEVTKWARGDPFWKTNFFSATKLRNKNKNDEYYYDVFLAKMKSERKNNGTANRIEIPTARSY